MVKSVGEKGELELVKEKTAKEVEVEKVTVRAEVELEQEAETCPECGSPNLVMDHRRGEVVCMDCGLVVDDLSIDPHPEWTAYTKEELVKKCRVGPPVTNTIHDRGLSTFIDTRNKDLYGRKISPELANRMYRLRRLQNKQKAHGSYEKSLVNALSEIHRLISALGLPDSVKETAAVIYRKATAEGIVKGRCIEGVTAAAVYAACRQMGIPRPLDEIAKHSTMGKKEIGRAYRLIAKTLELKSAPLSPRDYVNRYCSELGLSGKVRKEAIEILAKAEEIGITCSRNPVGMAAAAIYIAAAKNGERRTQGEIAEVTGVTTVTVRNRYKELVNKLDIDIML